MSEDPKMIPIGPAAKYLGVSRDTLRRWEKKGKLKSFRSPSNRRYYTKEQLNEVMMGKKADSAKSGEQVSKSAEVGKRVKIGKTGQLFSIAVTSFILAALLAVLVQFFLL